MTLARVPGPANGPLPGRCQDHAVLEFYQFMDEFDGEVEGVESSFVGERRR